MPPKPRRRHAAPQGVLGAKGAKLVERLGELSLEVNAPDYRAVAQELRDHSDLAFEQLIDLCGVDYSAFGEQPWPRERFAVALQLLSITHNWRLRLRVFCP